MSRIFSAGLERHFRDGLNMMRVDQSSASMMFCLFEHHHGRRMMSQLSDMRGKMMVSACRTTNSRTIDITWGNIAEKVHRNGYSDVASSFLSSAKPTAASMATSAALMMNCTHSSHTRLPSQIREQLASSHALASSPQLRSPKLDCNVSKDPNNKRLALPRSDKRK